ncbi:hypothetical protein ACIQTZ_12390 [Paenarthrobacter sp. NPDC090520]|uniref:hypothetical protein n=1 Tax=Paenarthrobacter sp. NPDC090520 TaxID=3364382 RepID=UPI00382E8B95
MFDYYTSTFGGKLRKILLPAATIGSIILSTLVSVPAAQAADDLVASGILRDSSGNAVEAGQEVSLLAWPRAETQKNAKTGEKLKLNVVATSVTDDKGRFSLTVNDDRAVKLATSENGHVDFSISSSARNGESYWYSFDKKLASEVGESAEVARQNLQSRQKTRFLDLAPLTSAGSAAPAVPSDVASESLALKAAANCTSAKVQTYAPRWVTVGASFALGPSYYTTANFKMTASASSSIGIGVSPTGSFGSFSASGERTVSVSSENNYGTVNQGHKKTYQTQFVFAKYHVRCLTNPTTGVWTDKYEVRPESHFGGTQKVDTSITPAKNYCSEIAAESSITRTDNNAITWTGGAATQSDIGINLSAKTGYSTSASLTYSSLDRRQYCGSHAGPGQANPGHIMLGDLV